MSKEEQVKVDARTRRTEDRIKELKAIVGQGDGDQRRGGDQDILTKYKAAAGIKEDDQKRRWDLVPWDEMGDVVDVLTRGARKYPAADNWKKVPDARDRYFAAAMRHLTDWWSEAQDHADMETGKSHLAHATCCLLFLMWHENRNAD